MAKKTNEPQEEFHPKGTALVLAIFVVTLIILWGSVYLTMLARGMTV